MSVETEPEADRTPEATPAASALAAACTIISKNYLAYARTIARAFRTHHPDHPFFVLLVDRLDGYFDPDREPFELVPIERLTIPDLQRFTFQYSILELNTAVKPYFLEYLLNARGLGRVLYFDPDILITAEVSHLFRLLGECSILLTPHLTTPIDDGHKPSELDILLSGVYNLGFIGVAATPTTRRFLHWWKERLYTKCQIAHEKGMFVDQRWVDLVPGLFDDVHILKDPAYNVAYWNLHSRRVEFHGGQVTVDGGPCRFFHFSGFDPTDMSMLSKHQTRFGMRTFQSVARLFEHYRNLLGANGYAESRTWPYAFGSFSDGTRIPDIVRVIYRELGDSATRFGDPFRVDGPSTFVSWLWESVDGDWDATRTISRFWYEIYQQRPDLQAAYPDILGVDRDAFVAWARTTGAAEYMIGDGASPGRRSAIHRLYARFVVPLEPVLAPTLQRLTRHRSRLWRRITRFRNALRGARPAARAGGPVRFALGGVNVAGYFASEKGVGAAGRATVAALEAASVPCVLANVVDSGSRNLEGRDFEDRPDNPYLVNLLHVNADQVPTVAAAMGADYFRGHYNIGAWFWELSRFPAEWRGSFRYFDEIWTYSSFCLDAVSRVSPIPVVRMPLAVAPASPGPAAGDRGRLGIGPDRFLFLFMFDFHSFVERKNPLGLIRAFELAFGGRRDVALLMKTSHSADNPAELAELRAAIRTDTVTILDDVLSRAEVMELLAACDCYVSLHRSEGFGLPIAEAMALGKPVIVTAYSGNMDFTTPSNSYLVKYRPIELARTHGPYQKGSVWADPDLEHAAALMRRVVDERDEAQRVAAAGRRDIETLLHPRVVGAQMRARLDEIWTGGATVTLRSARPFGAMSSGGGATRVAAADPGAKARAAASPGIPSAEVRVDADLAGLHRTYDLRSTPLRSDRAWIGPPVLLAKRLLRRLLTPIISQQAAYNAANARLVTWLAARVEDLIGREQEFRALEKRLARQRRMMGAVGRQVARDEAALKALERSSRSLEFRLRSVLDELSQVSADRQGPAGADHGAPDPTPHLAGFDSLGFHDRFRGDEAEIRERQRQYVELFKGAKEVLDIGCGRGEFLELLREAGIGGRGVERSLNMAVLCRERGLDVTHGDAFAHIAGLPDESLDGVFSAQVIEHLRPADILRLVQLCRAKLRPGGVIVLETVNVQCVSVFARSFYMDFTHVWPCHPEAMRYVLESAGFRDVRLTFSSPVDPEAQLPILPDERVFGEATERFNKAARLLNELILGYQDYAVTGYRT